jgi:phosphatidylglycerophosphate synthase
MFTKLDGKKVNAGCIGVIIVNSALAYNGVMPLWVAILSIEAALIVMFLRSAARKLENKLDNVKVEKDKSVSRFVR